MSLYQKFEHIIKNLYQKRMKRGGHGNHTHIACILGSYKRNIGQNIIRPTNSIHAEQDLIKNLLSKKNSCKKRGYFSN